SHPDILPCFASGVQRIFAEGRRRGQALVCLYGSRAVDITKNQGRNLIRGPTMTIETPSRRDFSRTVVTGAAALTAASWARAAGAGKRLRFGVIGGGGMGTGPLHALVRRGKKDDLEVVAVCDVYQRRLSRAEKLTKAKGYRDYRDLLDRKDIDAVLIAT